MDILDHIELFDCPRCGGPGILEEENGWCTYVACYDCGCRTAELPYNNESERIAAIEKVAMTWNLGKTIYTGASD